MSLALSVRVGGRGMHLLVMSACRYCPSPHWEEPLGIQDSGDRVVLELVDWDPAVHYVVRTGLVAAYEPGLSCIEGLIAGVRRS